jgi:DNA-binding transcriptional LysR family regulator
LDRIDAHRLFVALAERGSFSAAARALKIKQSTASKWVAALESELGANLVQRTTRSVHLTESGRRLLVRSRELLAGFDALRDEFRAQNPAPSGRLRLSLPVVFGRLFIVPALAEFLARHPQVSAELVFNDRYVNVVEEEFDLALRVGVPIDTSARGRKLAESRRMLVASPAYVAAHGRPKLPKDLRQHQCLVHAGESSTIWRFARGVERELPVPVRGRVAANNSEAVLLLVRRGLGIALLADWLVQAELARGRLVTLLEDFSTPSAPIYALTPPGKFASTAVRALIDHLATSLESQLAKLDSGARMG